MKFKYSYSQLITGLDLIVTRSPVILILPLFIISLDFFGSSSEIKTNILIAFFNRGWFQNRILLLGSFSLFNCKIKSKRNAAFSEQEPRHMRMPKSFKLKRSTVFFSLMETEIRDSVFKSIWLSINLVSLNTTTSKDLNLSWGFEPLAKDGGLPLKMIDLEAGC